jgi:hypothetical protein
VKLLLDMCLWGNQRFQPGSKTWRCISFEMPVSWRWRRWRRWLTDRRGAQMGILKQNGIGALTFGVEVMKNKTSYPSSPTWMLYTGEEDRCNDDVPILVRKEVFCGSYFAEARVFRTYHSWVLSLLLGQVLLPPPPPNPSVVSSQPPKPLFCLTPPHHNPQLLLPTLGRNLKGHDEALTSKTLPGRSRPRDAQFLRRQKDGASKKGDKIILRRI